MVTKLISLFVLLFCTINNVWALPFSGPYAGALIGSSDMNYTSGNQGLAGAAKDEQNRAWYVFAGYQFNRNFAINTGYLQFGEVKFEGINQVAGAKTDYSQKALEISGKLIYPLSSVATVYAKGGGAFVNLDRSPNSIAAVYNIPSSDKTKLKPIYGLGFTYEFYPGISGEVAWTEINGGDDIETSNFVGIGVNFAIG